MPALLPKIWLLTLETGSGTSSKKASRHKVLLHRKFWTSAILMLLNFVSNGQINVLLSYLSQCICYTMNLWQLCSWTKTLLQMRLFVWRKNLIMFLFSRLSLMGLKEFYRTSKPCLTRLQHPKVLVMLLRALNVVTSDCCARSMLFIPHSTSQRGFLD